MARSRKSRNVRKLFPAMIRVTSTDVFLVPESDVQLQFLISELERTQPVRPTRVTKVSAQEVKQLLAAR